MLGRVCDFQGKASDGESGEGRDCRLHFADVAIGSVSDGVPYGLTDLRLPEHILSVGWKYHIPAILLDAAQRHCVRLSANLPIRILDSQM